MQQSKLEQNQQTNVANSTATAAPIIARRKSCNPDGVGLSHYVLMDRKKAQ